MTERQGMSPPIFEVLLTLKDGPYGTEAVFARLHELGGSGPPAIASFYRTLKKAVDSGYVDVIESLGPAGRGRPPQRYRLTAAGRAALRAEARRLGKLATLALSELPPTGKS
jgi:DNA-binding PadR family transcriptional regulator